MKKHSATILRSSKILRFFLLAACLSATSLALINFLTKDISCLEFFICVIMIASISIYLYASNYNIRSSQRINELSSIRIDRSLSRMSSIIDSKLIKIQKTTLASISSQLDSLNASLKSTVIETSHSTESKIENIDIDLKTQNEEDRTSTKRILNTIKNHSIIQTKETRELLEQTTRPLIGKLEGQDSLSEDNLFRTLVALQQMNASISLLQTEMKTLTESVISNNSVLSDD